MVAKETHHRVTHNEQGDLGELVMRTGDSPVEVVVADLFSARLGVERVLAAFIAESSIAKAAHVIREHGDAVRSPVGVYECIAADVLDVAVYKNHDGYSLDVRWG